jgi:hypothetical protein
LFPCVRVTAESFKSAMRACPDEGVFCVPPF